MANNLYNVQLLAELYEDGPQAVILFTPVKQQNSNVTNLDFAFAYCNKTASAYFNATPENLKRFTLLSVPMPDEKLRTEVIEDVRKVYQSGAPSSTTVHNKILNRYANIVRTRKFGGVLSVFQDVTKINQLVLELEQQKLFTENILNAALNGFFVCEAVRNGEGTITDLLYITANKKAEEVLKITKDELIGKRILQMYPKIKESGLFDMYCQVIETGQPARKEIYFKGDYVEGWFDIATSKLNNDRVIVSFADITAEKKAALEIIQQKNVLDNILQHSTAGISVTEVIRDEAGNIADFINIIANESAMKYIGLSKEDYLQKTLLQNDPAAFDNPIHKMVMKTLQTGEPLSTQYQFAPTGRWLELLVAKMDNDHLINVFLDITHAKETQLQLEKLVTELQQTNANLEEFAYAASHDLKEPIRKMALFADRLKNQLLDRMEEEEVLLFDRMEQSAKRMNLLVEDLLVYSHVSLRTNLDENVDLNLKVKNVLTDLDLLIDEKAAIITVDKLPVIKGHKRQMQQLFQNLIGNALKYSKAGVPPEISITCQTVLGKDLGVEITSDEKDKPFYVIEITDNGIGFEPSETERIFQVFQRLHGKTEYTGTGVGLAIVKKAVQNHHGYITATGRPGVGATFKIMLPAS